MKIAVPFVLALSGAGFLCSGAEAASTTFGGSVTGRAGYGKNPNFNALSDDSSAVFGGDVTAVLARLTGTGRTALTGTADITQPTGGSGRSENYSVRLSQSQQINPKLSFAGDVGYQYSTNPGALYSTDSRDLVPIGDVLTIGTRTQSITGNLNAAYQWDPRNLVQIGVNAGRTTYSTANASGYTQYGVNFGYLRTISSSTRIGFQLSALKVHSDAFSSSSSYTGGLALTQKIGRVWTFQGGLNGVLQNAIGGTFRTIGFNGSLCGDYPRLSVCFLGSRQGAASGIGGLRIDTQGGARVNYKITARSSVEIEATYDISSAKDVILPTQHYIDGGVTYRRTISQRLSAGFSARYQRRNIGATANVLSNNITSYVGTADIVYSFGRIS